MTGLSSFDFYFRSTIFPFLFLMSSRPSSVLLFLLFVCCPVFTFLCSSSVSRLPCSERSSLSRFLFPTSHFPLSRFLVISFLFFLNFFPRHYSSLQSSNFDSLQTMGNKCQPANVIDWSLVQNIFTMGW